MQYNWGNVVDVSSFVLVEASGDSEAPSDPDLAAAVADEDDAGSCVCDPSDSGNGEEERRMGWRRIFRGDVIRACRGFDDDDGDEEGEVCSSTLDRQKKKRKRSDEMASGSAPEKCRKRNDGYGDSNKKEVVVNEMERNKLFWESCLAS